MSTTTTNYGLTKPDYNDAADIAILNGNADKVDAELKKAENHRNNTVAHMTQAQKDQLAAAVPKTRTIAGLDLSKDISADSLIEVAGLCKQSQSGLWTPTIYGSDVAGSQTYNDHYGNWIKLGPIVLIEGVIELSGKNGMTGNVLIGGLPFIQTYAMLIAQVKNQGLITVQNGLLTFAGQQFANWLYLKYNSITGGTQNFITADDIADGAVLSFSAIYLTAE